ncbi:ADD domain-containing protein 1 isoform X4 [Musca autumnalis]|uniref:ADD domain-containing protein 1 isoform X4 n=1 Tax=Musca autumnalis TaxID=221902 RepID=UPI003CE906CA
MSEPTAAAAGSSSEINVADSNKASNYEFHPSISEEEKRFYLKAYPTVDIVRDRKVHCTVCKTHIGTAPIQETGIKMHPILRVTHCLKCHDFYNSGEFSKGEDGSELYCRWCGQGGEVYCCSSCPYVFCKSCIVKNLSRGVVADIEQNENWNCFSCAPKILWPLRAQHWALMNYIEQQKKEAYGMNLSEPELNQWLRRDRSKCCRLAKAKCGNMSDSMESLDSVQSKRSQGSSSGSAKKAAKHATTPSPQQPNAKRSKNNDEVVCTPDLLSMLEPDCQITVTQKNNSSTPQQRPMPSPSSSGPSPRIISIQQSPSSYGGGANINQSSTPKSSVPPPLLLRNTAIKLRPTAQPPIVRRTVIGPRTPAPGGSTTPVYHTINGYRIDLNSAAQQETFRLPNGKLIQVKRQGPPPGANPAPTNNWQQMQQQQRVVPQTIASRPVQITAHPYPGPNVIQTPPGQPQVVRYHNNVIGSTTINAVAGHNGPTPLQAINGQIQAQPQVANVQQQMPPGQPIRPVMVRHIFPDSPIGQARTQLQEQVFNAMEICTHLTNKVQTLTNSNAYKQAKNYLEVKELYIHLSYLLTYAIGRFKGLQDKCLADMRHLGFGNDADCLENGQLAADKQASDDEDNEIEIVEPKTDLITLDSDDDDEPAPAAKTPAAATPAQPQQPLIRIQKSIPATTPTTTTIAQSRVVITPLMQQPQRLPVAGFNNTMTARGTYVPPAAPVAATQITPIKIGTSSAPIALPPLVPVNNTITPVAQPAPPSLEDDENMDLMSMAQSFLASMLEVDVNDGSSRSSCETTPQTKKQPRKKTTNKPNPTLLKQKAMLELERLEEMKRNDQKLKMKCKVQLSKAEDEYPFVKSLLEAKRKKEEQLLEKNKKSPESTTTMMVNTGQETVEVHLVIEDDPPVNGGSSGKEDEQHKRKDSTEQNGSKETNLNESSNEKAKEATMDVFEISDDVLRDVKDNSLEILETSKVEEKEKTTVKDVVEKEISCNDPKDANDESSVAEPKESMETTSDNTKMDVDIEDDKETNNEESTAKDVADIEDVDVYKEIAKVLQRRSCDKQQQEEDTTEENETAADIPAAEQEDHENLTQGEIEEKDSNIEEEENIPSDEVEKPPTPLVDEVSENNSLLNVAMPLEAGISNDDLITKQQVTINPPATDEIEELNSVIATDEQQSTTSNGNV